MTIPYISITIAAMCCYSFLFLSIMAAKKNKIIYSFMLTLVCFLCWTGGSVLMRLQIFPGYKFWYEISIMAVFSLAFVLYNFLYSFLDVKGTFLRGTWIALNVIVLVLTHFDVFLDKPELVSDPAGHMYFKYSVDWRIVFPCLLSLAIILSSARLVVRAFKDNKYHPSWIFPVFAGMTALFAGNVLSVMPGNIFPWDTLSGIVNAVLIFYALYKKRMFKLSLLASRGTILMVVTIVATVVFSYTLHPIEASINTVLPQLAPYDTLVIAIVFGLSVTVFYKFFMKIADNLFIREERKQAQMLREFCLSVAKSLDLDDILLRLVDITKEAVGAEKIYVCLRSADGTHFYVARASSPLDLGAFTISAQSPCVDWFENNDACLFLKEFERTSMYKAMWEDEKEAFKRLKIACIVPLKSDRELSGMVLLSEKPKRGAISYEDVTFIESVKSMVSVVIYNASLYRQIYLEAKIDQLTGLLNRRAFHEKIEDAFAACRDHSLALAIINLDDFKLYNELYGHNEGDVALRRVADIIVSGVGDNGFAARYGGKEFAIVMPMTDTLQISRTVHSIKEQMTSIGKQSDIGVLKPLTFSAGICVYPYAASSVKELIGNADLAVYRAKRSGKNKVIVYSIEQQTLFAFKNSTITESKYDEYASTIYALTAAIDAKDHYTFSHSQNVAEYASRLASAYGLNKDHVRIIYEAGLLHDIGKISIPEHILTKAEKLCDDEYEIMKKHVESSIAMIRHLPSLDYVIPAAIGHHERWDGKGYPRALHGEDIPLSARCLSIADAFDAMTTNRSYRAALPVDKALIEIEHQAGRQFDPELSVLFVELVRKGEITIQSSHAEEFASAARIPAG